MKLLTQDQLARLIQNGKANADLGYQIAVFYGTQASRLCQAKAEYMPMELLDYDEQRNVTLKLSEQEFTELCDILSCVAHCGRDLDPSLLMVEKTRVSALNREIHAVLEKLTEHERKRHGK